MFLGAKPLFVMIAALAMMLEPARALALAHFSAEVTLNQGQNRILPFSAYYELVFKPMDTGWQIQVFDRRFPKTDLAIFTPPIHSGPFETQIIGRTFVDPQYTIGFQRTIIFSPKVVDVLKKRRGYVQPSDIDEIRRDGTANFAITDVSLGDLQGGMFKTVVRQVRFRVTIDFNPDPASSLTP